MKTAILISANEEKINMDELEMYLHKKKTFPWLLNRKINALHFKFPITCYVHICKKQTEYEMVVEEIIDYSPELLKQVEKTKIISKDLLEYYADLSNEDMDKKGAMIISEINKLHKPIKTNTLETKNGVRVKFAPQHYYEIVDPE